MRRSTSLQLILGGAKWPSCILLALFLFAPDAAAKRTTLGSVRGFQGKTISAVRVQGLKRIEAAAVREKVSSKVGRRLGLKTVRQDIKDIYSMGFFEDVTVSATDVGAKVALTYSLRERPIISEIIFDGNEQVDTEDLLEVVKVKEWSILEVNRVREDVNLIQKHYEEKGFYLAKVRYEIKRVKDGEVKLYYRINDYQKVQIKKITFLNNRVFSDTKLKSLLRETQEGGFFSFLSGSGSFKEASFKQDLQILTYWYLDNGYIKFRYENPSVTVSDDKRFLYISIYVEEGEKYDVGAIDFSGDLLFPKKELHEELTMVQGDGFRISKRNADIQRLTEKYQDLGYAFVNVIPKMDVNDKTKIVNITYHFEKGSLVYFGEINVTGNDKTHDKVIRRELRVHEGELYSGTRLRISRERVERLGYFSPGEVIFNTITRKDEPDIVDIEISVKERSTGTITLGAGYGSVSKFFLTTQISEINLFGKGQTLSFSGQFAADRLQKSVNLGFTDPYAFDTRWSMGFDLFFVNFLIPRRYLMRKLGFDVRLGYPLQDDVRAFITYKNEGANVLDKSIDEIDSSLDEGVLSSVVWSIVRDKRNNRFETTAGNYQRVAIETAGLGGDKKFLKWTLNNRYYKRIVGDLVFRNSVEYGQMAEVGGQQTPPAERFYLGGPNNMRGFETFQLAPTELVNNESVPKGGLVQMFALSELEYPLIREAGLKWVMFFDAGNTFERFPSESNGIPFTIRLDYGFGFRWFSPIGPLRFEWGFPINRRPGESEFSFWFFIGPPF